MEKKTFVLVHGSWQGAWSWDGVRDRLRARGHRVITPACPGGATSGRVGTRYAWKEV
jgi:pimeloyl-ACP methyl ester carboxylesterase